MPDEVGTGIQDNDNFLRDLDDFLARIEDFFENDVPIILAGARSGRHRGGRSGITKAVIDDMAGKIGPVVTVYNPEATDRLIQEF